VCECFLCFGFFCFCLVCVEKEKEIKKQKPSFSRAQISSSAQPGSRRPNRPSRPSCIRSPPLSHSLSPSHRQVGPPCRIHLQPPTRVLPPWPPAAVAPRRPSFSCAASSSTGAHSKCWRALIPCRLGLSPPAAQSPTTIHGGLRLLTVKICQPSHEFTFGVGISFIPYPLVLTPLV
jgi:hypothetical protein